jgi:alkylation response protein AidB-like acyl-CoA dehydrogenase
MSDTELAELADSVFAGARTDGTGFDAGLWAILEDTGLARLTLPAEAGGSDGTFADAAVVLDAAGAHAARVPLVETDLLAASLRITRRRSERAPGDCSALPRGKTPAFRPAFRAPPPSRPSARTVRLRFT